MPDRNLSAARYAFANDISSAALREAEIIAALEGDTERAERAAKIARAVAYHERRGSSARFEAAVDAFNRQPSKVYA